MSKLFSKVQDVLLAATTDAPAGGSKIIGETPSDKEEIIEFLADDGEEEPLKLDDKEKEKGDGETTEGEEEELSEGEEELKEIEEELEEPDEEKLELVTPVRRREILKKYPTLFKDFPYLENAYYREQQFTEVFPTIDDAKEAHEKAETLDKFEHDLMDGNIEVALTAVKTDNPRGFAKIVDNYLPTLAKVDEKAYHHVIGNTIKYTIMSMVQEAQTSGNDVLKNAAQVLNQFVFGSSNFTQPSKLSPERNTEEDTKEKEVKNRENEVVKRQFETSRDDLNTRVNNSLKATIEANIDPKDSMGPYVKKAASNEAFETLVSLVNRDTRFKTLLDRLWEDAFKKNFAKESVDKIRSAYLSKAKTLLPSVIKKARNEALRGIGKRVKDDTSEEKEESSGKRQSTSPKTPSGKITKPGDIPRGMKTIDFLMQE